MVQLISIIQSGFPKFQHELPPAHREYHQFHDHLYTADGVILYKACTVIPPFLRQHVLTVLHSAHQAMTSMTAHAEMIVFWPGITTGITATQTNYHHCNGMTPSQPNAPPFPLSCQHIPSSAYPLTFSTTRVTTALLWLTDIQTGPSLNRHKQDPRA